MLKAPFNMEVANSCTVPYKEPESTNTGITEATYMGVIEAMHTDLYSMPNTNRE